MFSTRLLQIGIAGSACAALLFAADFWKTKDSTQWTSDEVNKILSDSPWAKARTVQPQEATQQRGMGRRGGFGFPGGGYPGGGYPGGGGGYPGGGYPGGGGRYPGNGGGYPQAGGDPNGTGDGSNFPSRNEPMNLTIRWESASPIQQALMRQGASASDESKPVSELAEKYYVIEVLGWRMPRARNRGVVDADDTSANPNDDDAPRPARSKNNDALRSQLLDAAQLAPKGKSSIYAADVQIMGPEGIDGLRFLFPRTTPLSAADKDIEFILNFRRIRVDEKFKLSEMQFEGKLAL
jgi:hypothetical protein